MRRTIVGQLMVLALTAVIVAPALAGEPAPLFEDLGSFHREVTTQSKEAQRYFDQGMTLYYGFNHEEAMNSFQAAAALDPDCAIAYWGIALSVGPNINNPWMEDDAVKTAYEATTQALAHVDKASPVERDLIGALAKRYVESPPEDRSGLDKAYADAMREVWKKHPKDTDVGALFAESLMDLRPWDLWTKDGKMQPGTDEVVETLDAVLALDENHPLANHLNIHTWEASSTPGRAAASADRLRDMVPGAGHLVHMPGHIYIRMGRYADAVVANQKAIAADLRYVERTGRHGFYDMYRAHNYHFLAYAAMFEGRKEVAMRAAREMVDQIPLELVRTYPDFLDGFIAVPVHVMVRFGLWDEILAEPQPPADLYVTTAFWRYGRTVALSVLGRVDEATKEMELLDKAYEAVPESRLIGNNTARVVLDIGRPMAEGELEYRRGNYDRAFELLREAVRRDDELTDLKIHPDNGWSLHGLAECLRKTGREKEADEVGAKYRRAWARSDIRIMGSCYCRTKS
jgi:tetratricopeptide (TPR) repeat protein